MITLNEYFDGAVKSLGYTGKAGKSTVGVISAGEFTFGTSTPETMLIIEGELQVLLPGSEEWKHFRAGQQFEVAEGVSFHVKAEFPVCYLCRYE